MMDEEFVRLEQLTAIDRKLKLYKKEKDKIVASKTFKVGSPLLNFMNKDKASMLKLVNDLIIQNNELIEALEISKMNDINTQLFEIETIIRKQKDEGSLLSNLKEIIENKAKVKENYNHALLIIARLYASTDFKSTSIDQLLIQAYDTNDVPEYLMRSGFSDKKISLKAVASFSGLLTQRVRKTQVNPEMPEIHLDDKKNAYKFVDLLDLKRPNTDTVISNIKSLPKHPGYAIKPLDGAGARGVYLINDRTDILDISRSQKLKSIKELEESMTQDLMTKRVEKDEWFTEKIIYENKNQKLIARDLKFYTFYGEVQLVLEIIRYPELRHCWWNKEGERIRVGKYDESLFKGTGVSQAEIKKVEDLSLEIPVPFMRIDFLRSDEGLVFGEFTPKPGNYDEFDHSTDIELGDAFLKAEIRLENDLLNGKVFNKYKLIKS